MESINRFYFECEEFKTVVGGTYMIINTLGHIRNNLLKLK